TVRRQHGGGIGDKGNNAGGRRFGEARRELAKGGVARRRRRPGRCPGPGLSSHRPSRVHPDEGGLAREAPDGRFEVRGVRTERDHIADVRGRRDRDEPRVDQGLLQGPRGPRGRLPRNPCLRATRGPLAPCWDPTEPDPTGDLTTHWRDALASSRFDRAEGNQRFFLTRRRTPVRPAASPTTRAWLVRYSESRTTSTTALL